MGGSRRFSVHQSLGGASVADVLMWKNSGASIAVLMSCSIFWLMFERGGYNFLTFVANVLLLLVVILFLWAKSALLLNRPLPPIPELEVSEESLMGAADVVRVWINKALLIAKEIAVHRNLRLLVQVVLVLWFISFIGSFFSLITLLYLGVLLCLSVPLVYDKYQERIEDKLVAVISNVQAQYRKIPLSLSKDKKTQ
ncbi:hypothetical protein Leryth_011554 [Lithospermum erythrorhizon]|uniref:Reticulon-like protein n=1 Tax=Lithospermum erythrorhizon TaxID=34254 RepID=A0AAV3PVQ3_LITER|nr:hypothetical protein Leryth_011554 [Lithospermum erythrorhizon]